MQPTFPTSYGGGVQSPDVSGLQGRTTPLSSH
jgi:hypothetical protein